MLLSLLVIALMALHASLSISILQKDLFKPFFMHLQYRPDNDFTAAWTANPCDMGMNFIFATPKLSEDKVKQCGDAKLNGEYPPTTVAKDGCGPSFGLLLPLVVVVVAGYLSNFRQFVNMNCKLKHEHGWKHTDTVSSSDSAISSTFDGGSGIDWSRLQ
ncbi:hypothetical protein Pint_06905 [Pistacia integerrima]|uniref:Uncharacterized protein n=1 Tax=Pistacia integerrima TaxID=434235 RepID=A0ACC0XVS8_9ROSI|nr:hypothetical protein Pint_06905 [Pistacia integerrima]